MVIAVAADQIDPIRLDFRVSMSCVAFVDDDAAFITDDAAFFYLLHGWRCFVPVLEIEIE